MDTGDTGDSGECIQCTGSAVRHTRTLPQGGVMLGHTYNSDGMERSSAEVFSDRRIKESL